jgi:myo-inositol-1(or 4)-monophosphatase
MELATKAVLSAAEPLTQNFQQGTAILSNQGRDIKLAADQLAHQLVVDTLITSDLPVFSEESGSELPDLNDLRQSLWWLVDPLDGSANFNRGFPLWASSIALLRGQTPLLGVIYDVVGAKLYQGIAEVGSFCNGHSLRVTTTDSVSQAILTTGFPTGRNYSAISIQQTIERIQAFKKIRMLGSAALSLCTVASGTFDAYYEEDIWLWDVAAGMVLVQGAGGHVQMTQPKPNLKATVAAWNGHLPITWF